MYCGFTSRSVALQTRAGRFRSPPGRTVGTREGRSAPPRQVLGSSSPDSGRRQRLLPAPPSRQATRGEYSIILGKKIGDFAPGGARTPASGPEKARKSAPVRRPAAQNLFPYRAAAARIRRAAQQDTLVILLTSG